MKSGIPFKPFTEAFLRRLASGSDAGAAVVAEELLEEVRTNESQKASSFVESSQKTIAAGIMAMELFPQIPADMTFHEHGGVVDRHCSRMDYRWPLSKL